MKRIIRSMMVGACAALGGCAAQADGEAPAAATASVDEREVNEEGTTFDGWTQSSSVVALAPETGLFHLSHTLTRTSGDETRSGGVCAVVLAGQACRQDSDCFDRAKSVWGPDSYGYCYEGACYSRPGGDDQCKKQPSRSPGTIEADVKAAYGRDGASFAIGCMSKSALNPAACSLPDSAGYMRVIVKRDE